MDTDSTQTLEIDTLSSMPLGEEGDLWTSTFVPPPPGPEFIDDDDDDDDFIGPESFRTRRLIWVTALMTISLLTAFIWGVVMIIVVKCRKRLKHLSHGTGACSCFSRDEERGTPAPTPSDSLSTVAETSSSNGELDSASSNSPAFQDKTYIRFDVDTDYPHSSAPSSANHSDLPCAPSDRTYETMGPPLVTFCDNLILPPILELSSSRYETITEL